MNLHTILDLTFESRETGEKTQNRKQNRESGEQSVCSERKASRKTHEVCLKDKVYIMV